MAAGHAENHLQRVFFIANTHRVIPKEKLQR